MGTKINTLLGNWMCNGERGDQNKQKVKKKLKQKNKEPIQTTKRKSETHPHNELTHSTGI
jgi:hypothetical protein